MSSKLVSCVHTGSHDPHSHQGVVLQVSPKADDVLQLFVSCYSNSWNLSIIAMERFSYFQRSIQS